MGSIITDGIEVTAYVFTIIASGIAIYLFLFKSERISKALRALTNYSYQLSLSELKAKLDRLNDLNVNEPTDIDEVINILSEIVGQIRGNRKLKKYFSELLEKISSYVENPKKLIEPKKRSIVSELRENLRHIDIESIDELIGGK